MPSLHPSNVNYITNKKKCYKHNNTHSTSKQRCTESELTPLESLVIDHLINEELEREKIINQVYFRSCNSASLNAVQAKMHCVQAPSHETIKTVIDNFIKLELVKSLSQIL